MVTLRQTLPEGPLDIVGDVHGEIDALRSLLRHLGVDLRSRTAERPLVFVGDLVDRGPDSVAVVELVRALVERGQAHCVAGNHEINLLLADRKEGNGWAWADATDHHQPKEPPGARPQPFDSRLATPAERDAILDFFGTLPLVLERRDLRVVHACWHPAALAGLPGEADLAAFAETCTQEIVDALRSDGTFSRAMAQRAAFADLRKRGVEPDRHLDAHAAVSLATQNDHPVKALTSGLEVPVAPGRHFFTGGKWRFVMRAPWWETYEEEPAVVVGHYWRRRAGASVDDKPDSWRTETFADWAGPRGNVFCVDYSVGRRFVERHAGRRSGFSGGLAALRWPERVLVFDDDPQPRPTTLWGG